MRRSRLSKVRGSAPTVKGLRISKMKEQEFFAPFSFLAQFETLVVASSGRPALWVRTEGCGPDRLESTTPDPSLRPKNGFAENDAISAEIQVEKYAEWTDPLFQVKAALRNCPSFRGGSDSALCARERQLPRLSERRAPRERDWHRADRSGGACV